MLQQTHSTTQVPYVRDISLGTQHQSRIG